MIIPSEIPDNRSIYSQISAACFRKKIPAVQGGSYESGAGSQGPDPQELGRAQKDYQKSYREALESSSGNTSFTTNNFTHFGIAKGTEGFVDLSLVHETLFSLVFFHNTCHFVLSLPLEPSLLASFTFFLLYPPAGPLQCYPGGVGSFPFLFTPFFTPTAMPSAAIGSWPDLPSELRSPIS